MSTTQIMVFNSGLLDVWTNINLADAMLNGFDPTHALLPASCPHQFGEYFGKLGKAIEAHTGSNCVNKESIFVPVGEDLARSFIYVACTWARNLWDRGDEENIHIAKFIANTLKIHFAQSHEFYIKCVTEWGTAYKNKIKSQPNPRVSEEGL